MSRSISPRDVSEVISAIQKIVEDNHFELRACPNNLKLYQAPESNNGDEEFFALSVFINKFVPQDSSNDVAVRIYSLLCRRPIQFVRSSFDEAKADDIKESASLRKNPFKEIASKYSSK